MRLGYAVSCALAVTLAMRAAGAQSKPAFSGTWRLDSLRSVIGGRGNPATEITVSQDATTLTIVRGGSAGSQQLVYRLDGSESRNVVGRVAATFRSTWDGNALVTTITTQGLQGQTTQTETLSIAGGDLRINAARPDPQGGAPYVSRLVYVPQRGERRTVDFERDSLGRAPNGFTFAHTAQVGIPGAWIVQSDGQWPARGRFLAQIGADPTQLRFPVAVVDGVVAKDVELRVLTYPVSGTLDQAAGLVWRYQDENNYYVVRTNARENNVVLYKVENGRRIDLPLRGVGRTYGERVPVPARQWTELRVVVRGALFEVHYGGRTLFEVEDSTFPSAGRVGLWTKADSITYFDNLVITVLPS